MVDKIVSMPESKIGKIIGRIDAQTLALVDRALLAWLGLSVER
jgi:mRNA-degrading endonuclease toxin of MazEF toxin-antitoxin module